MHGLLIFAVFMAFTALLDKIESIAQFYMNYRLNEAQIRLQEAQDKARGNNTNEKDAEEEEE